MRARSRRSIPGSSEGLAGIGSIGWASAAPRRREAARDGERNVTNDGKAKAAERSRARPVYE